MSNAGDVLAFAPILPSRSRLTWFDRTGNVVGTVGEPDRFVALALGPDGKRIAAAVAESKSGIASIWEFHPGGVPRRITFGSGAVSLLRWLPSGSGLVFSTLQGGPFNLLAQTSSSPGAKEHVILDLGIGNWLNDVSPDGRFAMVAIDSKDTGGDLHYVALDGSNQLQVYLRTAAYEGGGTFSPDGKWVSYVSPSGTEEQNVFVRRFPPTTDDQYQVTTKGGRNATWRADGRELYFVAAESMLTAAAIDTSSGFSVRSLTKLFKLPSPLAATGRWHQYDATGDGSRFIAVVPESQAQPVGITVVMNWLSLGDQQRP